MKDSVVTKSARLNRKVIKEIYIRHSNSKCRFGFNIPIEKEINVSMNSEHCKLAGLKLILKNARKWIVDETMFDFKNIHKASA